MALAPVASFDAYGPMPLLRKEMGIQVELDSEDVVSHVFIVESTTVYRKSGARVRSTTAFSGSESLVDGISAAGLPKSVKLSSRLRSLLRSEESNVLVGPVTYPKAHKNIQKPSKTIKTRASIPP